MTPHARAAFVALRATLAPLRVLCGADGIALRLLAEALAEYRAARAVVEREGETYTSTTKAGDVLIRTRPEVRIAASAWKRADTLLARFGLTPADRVRLGTLPEKPKGPAWVPEEEIAAAAADAEELTNALPGLPGRTGCN